VIVRREKVRFKTGFKSSKTLHQMSSYAEGEDTQKVREAKEGLAQGGTARR